MRLTTMAVVTVAFDVAPPGKPDAFTTYVSGTVRRASPRPPRS